MNRSHPDTAAPNPRVRRPRHLRAARMIEHRRPVAGRRPEPATPAVPVIRFDDEPMFVGSHLSAQLVQRQWRSW
jgi:hypothetical protein